MADASEKYGYQVAWSERDALYVAYCAELPGIAAHGDTPDEALREVRVAAKASVAMLTESDDPVPECCPRRRSNNEFCREQLSDGRVAYHLKQPWSDGTTAVAFFPDELF